MNDTTSLLIAKVPADWSAQWRPIPSDGNVCVIPHRRFQRTLEPFVKWLTLLQQWPKRGCVSIHEMGVGSRTLRQTRQSSDFTKTPPGCSSLISISLRSKYMLVQLSLSSTVSPTLRVVLGLRTVLLNVFYRRGLLSARWQQGYKVRIEAGGKK